MTAIKKIAKIGNGHFIPLPASVMADLNLRAGQEIKLSGADGALHVRAADDSYAKTRAASSKMIKRYRRALVKLGREGDAA